MIRVCMQVYCQVVTYRALLDEDKSCPGCGKIGDVKK